MVPAVRNECKAYLYHSDKMVCCSLSPVFKSELGSPSTIVHVHGFILFFIVGWYQKIIQGSGRNGEGGSSEEGSESGRMPDSDCCTHRMEMSRAMDERSSAHKGGGEVEGREGKRWSDK